MSITGTALAERSALTTPTVTGEQLELVKKTIANGATDAELKLFLFDCARQGVHPLDRLIHFTKRAGKYTPITSIDFMRIRAAESGEYAGSDDAKFEEDADPPPYSATVTVWRLVQGTRCPFTATARWSEYKPAENDFMWKRMPHTMLAKCAEALALRKGFPRQLAGLYAKEEMDQAGNGHGVAAIPEPAAVVVTDSGTTVDTDSGVELAPCPEGYHYLTGYTIHGEWHEADVLNWFDDGAALHVSTKLAKNHALMQKAANERIPVKCAITLKRNEPRKAYLNTIELLKAAPTQGELDAEIAKRDLAQRASEVA